jgi:hypothetical protein
MILTTLPKHQPSNLAKQQGHLPLNMSAARQTSHPHPAKRAKMGERTMLACTNCKQRKLKVSYPHRKAMVEIIGLNIFRHLQYSATGRAPDAVTALKPTEVID